MLKSIYTEKNFNTKSDLVLRKWTPDLPLISILRLVNTYIILIYGVMNYLLLMPNFVAFYAKLNELELSENLTITPALALPKHMAGIFDEKCREKEKYREEQIGECPFSIPRHNLSL